MALNRTEWDTTNGIGVEVHPNGRSRTPVIVWSGSPHRQTCVTSDEFCLTSADARENFVRKRISDLQQSAVLALLERLSVTVAQSRDSTSDRDETRGTGQAVAFPAEEPAHEEVDGGQLLDDLAATVLKYLALAKESADAIALWILHAYCLEAAQVSPTLAIVSPVKRCGKTTLLTLLGALVPRALPATNVTAAAIFRAVEQFAPTLLIDEADTFLITREDKGDLRGILNSSHTRSGARVLRTVPVGDSFEVRSFSTWCAKAIALIGKLPDTLRDRSIPVMMRRRARGEDVERLRLDRLEGFSPLRRRAVRWVADRVNDLSPEPDMPAELNDRAADNWRPLLAIADAAGSEWPARARRAALALSGIGMNNSASRSELLLADLEQIFRDRAPADRLPTQRILAALCKREDRPWSEWNNGRPISGVGLAKLLEPFEVGPRTLRQGKQVFRGYLLHDFEPAFARYVPQVAVTPATPLVDGPLPHS